MESCRTVSYVPLLISQPDAGFIIIDTEEGGYHKILKLAIGIKAVAFALGVGYIVVDCQNLGKGMTMTRKQREKRETEVEDADRDPLT